LEELNVGGNEQLGNAAAELICANLTQLEKLWMYEMGLTGAIFVCVACVPCSVCEDMLGHSHVVAELPITIGDLSSLEVLSIQDNKQLIALPSTIGWLSKLKKLDVENCALSGRIYF
jgi:hypothetical protein